MDEIFELTCDVCIKCLILNKINCDSCEKNSQYINKYQHNKKNLKYCKIIKENIRITFDKNYIKIFLLFKNFLRNTFIFDTYNFSNFKVFNYNKSKIKINFKNFSQEIKKVYIACNLFSKCSDHKMQMTFFDLPKNLETLEVIGFTDINLNNLPERLKKLICKYCRIKELNNLPIELKYLDCSNNYITNIDFLPESLIYLDCSNNNLNNLYNLPNSLKYLITIGNNIGVNYILPKNLIQYNSAKFNVNYE